MAIGASAIQVFTKTPNQWREPVVADDTVDAFRREVARTGITHIVSHDSYLINLASPDPALRQRSEASFRAELERCERLGIRFVVSHPGNFIDDRGRASGATPSPIRAASARCPAPSACCSRPPRAPGPALGSTFEELAELRDAIGDDVRHRVAFCADTCHLYSAGYDLVRDFDGVWRRWEAAIGLSQLRCLHLNDSKTPFASRRDRHELIAEGTLGAEPFRRIMRDPRFAGVMKVIETPKGDDEVTQDRRMLRRLRAYARVRPAR